MTKPDDILQERLFRLEAGDSLVACLDGLSDELAAPVKLVSSLRKIPLPQRDEKKVEALRVKLMEVAQSALPNPPKENFDMNKKKPGWNLSWPPLVLSG